MNDILDIFDKLNQLTSNKDKEVLLNTWNKADERLEVLLHAGLDPRRLYYVRKMPEYTPSGVSSGIIYFKNFLRLLDKLENRKLTGNAAKDRIIKEFSSYPPDEASLYEKILTKKALGVKAKTVNKVWDSLIYDFTPMLAPNKNCNPNELNYPCYVQPKLDGFRCIYQPNGKYFFLSRSGKPLVNKNLKTYFNNLIGLQEYVLDGELYDSTISFQKLDSILTSEDAKLPNTLKFNIFDCIPVDDWNNKDCNVKYDERIKQLRLIVNTLGDYNKFIDVSTDTVNTPKELLKIYKNYLEKGYEGVMLKDISGLYRWKRVTLKSAEMIKLKPFKSIDVPIADIYEGEDSFSGVAGGIVIDYNGTKVKVGTGKALTHHMRLLLRNNSQEYLGKMVEIKYLEETDTSSLRHPVFERFRPDKDL